MTSQNHRKLTNLKILGLISLRYLGEAPSWSKTFGPSDQLAFTIYLYCRIMRKR